MGGKGYGAFVALRVDLEVYPAGADKMNHKRGKAKNGRAGCLMCKPHKINGAGDKLKLHPHKTGGGRFRAEVAARDDAKEKP